MTGQFCSLAILEFLSKLASSEGYRQAGCSDHALSGEIGVGRFPHTGELIIETSYRWVYHMSLGELSELGWASVIYVWWAWWIQIWERRQVCILIQSIVLLVGFIRVWVWDQRKLGPNQCDHHGGQAGCTRVSLSLLFSKFPVFFFREILALKSSMFCVFKYRCHPLILFMVRETERGAIVSQSYKRLQTRGFEWVLAQN